MVSGDSEKCYIEDGRGGVIKSDRHISVLKGLFPKRHAQVSP